MMDVSRARLGAGLLLLALALPLGSCEQVQQVVDFINSISDGAPCASSTDCLGGTCIGADQGYPGGYCTTLACDTAGCSGFFSECFNTEVAGAAVAACYALCNLDGTCDRAAQGYQCVSFQDTPVCLPPGATNAPLQGELGSACSADPQCNGEGAACLQSFFGGYCAIVACTGSASCPDANPCVALNPEGATDEERAFACMRGCTADSDCRFGYTCQDYEGERICLERPDGTLPRNPNGVDDGQACVANINCKGGTCVREAEGEGGQVSYPGGYCTTRDCEDDASCNGPGTLCVSLGRSTSCRTACVSDSDCRSGYACRDGEQGRSYCDSIAPALPSPEPAQDADLNVVCSNTKSLSFELPAGSIGFYIAPFSKQQQKVTPLTLRVPSGRTLDIRTEYAFMAINPDLLGNLAPIQFPATDAPNLRDLFGPGAYTMTVQTSAPELCYYVIPKRAEGATIDLNLYVVGVPGLTATSARDDADVRQVVDTMRAIYAPMGIDVRVAAYLAPSQALVTRYSVIRDLYDVFNLVAASQTPSGGLEQKLAVNVFLIEDFNVADAPGLLGLSTGIPGMAGLHGTTGSGLVFSTASLGLDNASLGQTLAHEVGHFLGLRHTTEHGGSSADPISDTPRCLNPQLGFKCQDAENFMFPFSLGGNRQVKSTAGQRFVLRRSPLVK